MIGIETMMRGTLCLLSVFGRVGRLRTFKVLALARPLRGSQVAVDASATSSHIHPIYYYTMYPFMPLQRKV